MNDWTKADDAALIEAYLGYEVQKWKHDGDPMVCIDGDGKTMRVPDMTTREGWALDCLDSWLSVSETREAHCEMFPGSRSRRVWLREDSAYKSIRGEGATLPEAVARALRAAVEEPDNAK